MRYNQHFDYRKRKRFLRRICVAAALCLVGLLIFGFYIFRDNFASGNFNSEEQTTSASTTSYVAPSVKVFRSPYFQFQADRNWVEDSTNSSDGKYAYKSFKNGLIEHQLTIYVNTPPSNLSVTRTLVTVTNGNRGLKTVKTSDHCGKATNFTSTPKAVSLDKVTFNCFGDDTRYTVLVGVEGGTTNISLPRPDGSSASYTIYYSNLTAMPDSFQLEDIIKTFQTR